MDPHKLTTDFTIFFFEALQSNYIILGDLHFPFSRGVYCKQSK